MRWLRPKRLLTWLVVVVVVVLIVLALRPQPLPVELAEVERGALEVTVEEEGETRVRDRFMVSAPVAGRVLRIRLEPGDPVVAGETVLATFQPSLPALLDARSRAEAEAALRATRAAVGRARAERERAQAELEYARAELTRYETMARKEIISTDALEAAQRNARAGEEAQRAANYAVSTAEHELGVATARLMQTGGDPEGDGLDPIQLQSPIDGVVLRRLRESEAVVPPGDPLIEVGDASDLEIVADLLSSDAVKVTEGARVYVERWGGDRALAGRVRRIEPAGFTKVSALGVEEQRVNVIVDFEPGQADVAALGDGFRVEVRIVIWTDDDVLKVPTSALFRRGDDWAAFVVGADELASERPLQTGHSNGLEMEVLDGLTAGDRVIVHPSDDVADGVEVLARGG